MPVVYDENLSPNPAGKVQRKPEVAGSAPSRTLDYGEAAAILQPKRSTFFEDLFARIDASSDKSIDRDEVKAHLGRVGVGAGLFGVVHSGVAKKFMKQLDKNGDDKVTFAEFKGVASQLMPPDLFDEKGNIKPALVGDSFKRLDGDGDGRLTEKEFEQALLEQLPEDTSMRSIVAEVMSKLGTDALDLDRDGAVTHGEFSDAARAVGGLKD